MKENEKNSSETIFYPICESKSIVLPIKKNTLNKLFNKYGLDIVKNRFCIQSPNKNIQPTSILDNTIWH